ncbi:hypothetical protein COEREDRAFT_94660 [Coemansia reversa NRRL 1564]|uniref:Cysteine-rich transmembrane CYSTM domain-containing protein n=1 Tax=Coemansia reversa (strain ATCC 12441 / NRRL 1564) TaxID=763665 RepID=A0A2G5B2T2_COERN|nr:hypothetical protein COEREDRAFT_94660 [Coemansia reversa NRRL 1564]|eukprot:PIA13304.1 hypothetical protein COEREDRAFT_94660 [Coemansia reversa NRRL 1564]
MSQGDTITMGAVPTTGYTPQQKPGQHYSGNYYNSAEANQSTNQPTVVLFDNERPQLKGGGCCGAFWGCLGALICCDILF